MHDHMFCFKSVNIHKLNIEIIGVDVNDYAFFSNNMNMGHSVNATGESFFPSKKPIFKDTLNIITKQERESISYINLKKYFNQEFFMA